MSCCTQCKIGHRPLVSIQLCFALSPPSSSSYKCILLSTFFFRSLFQVFIGHLLTLGPCGVHCSACLAMLSCKRVSKPVPFSGEKRQNRNVIAITHNSTFENGAKVVEHKELETLYKRCLQPPCNPFQI